MKKKCFFIISIILVFIFGISKVFLLNEKNDEDLIGVSSRANYMDDNYVENEFTEIVNSISYGSEIEKIIIENAQGYEDNLSLYFYNFKTQEEYSYNGDEYYVAASTTKIPLAMAVADDVNNGKYSIYTEIEYDYSDYEEGTGILWTQDYIQPITVDEAIYLSIAYSDNITKNMLKRISTVSPYDYISNIAGNLESNNNENKYTANQLGQVLKKLYINEDNNPYYNDILEYMTESIFHDRIDKYLPYDNVAHKIGNYYRYYHDMGIVYGEEDYVLVIMTKDIGELDDDYYINEDERLLLDGGEMACEIIASISLEIYNLIN